MNMHQFTALLLLGAMACTYNAAQESTAGSTDPNAEAAAAVRNEDSNLQAEIERIRSVLVSIEQQVSDQGKKLTAIYDYLDAEVDFEEAKKAARAAEEEKRLDKERVLDKVNEFEDRMFSSKARFSPADNIFAVVMVDGSVKICGAENKQLMTTLRCPNEQVVSIAFSPDGETLLGGMRSGKLYRWNSDDESCKFIKEVAASEISRLDWAAEGGLVGWGSTMDYEKRKRQSNGGVLNVLTGESLCTYSASLRDDFQGLAMSSDGTKLVVHDIPGEPRGAAILDTTSGNMLKNFFSSEYPSGPLSVAISPDSTAVAVGYGPDDVIVWDVDSGTPKWLFEGHSNWVVSLAFSLDGRWLASGGGDSTARVYDLDAGEEVGRVRFAGSSTYVDSVDISHDGRLLLAAVNGYVGIYRMPLAEKAAALPTLESATNPDALRARIEEAKETVKVYGGGHVIVGRVVVEGSDDPELVNAQMRILEGGYFAGPTKDLTRPVGFRMHGYAPYDLELKGRKGAVVDVGDIKLRRLSEQELAPLTGKILLEGNEDPGGASVRLSVRGGPVNTPSNGTEPRPRWPEPIAVAVDSDGNLEPAKLSPMRYYCSISVPGYVKKGFSISSRPGIGADIGTVTLEKPLRIDLEYIVSKEGPFEIDALEQVVLSGGDRWKATPDIYGWDLAFVQKNGRPFFDYSYVPCSIADLGEGKLETFLRFDKSSAEFRTPNMPVEDGHVYLLNQEHWKRTVLFRVTVGP